MATRRNISLVAAPERAVRCITLDAHKYFDEWLQSLVRESTMSRASSQMARRRRRTIETAKLQPEPDQLTRLTFNENPLGPSPRGLAAARRAMADLHRYPDDDASRLKNALALRHCCNTDEIVTGNGSAELISLLTQTFCAPDSEDEVLAVTPSYPL